MDAPGLRESLRKQGIHLHESDSVLELDAICELAVADTARAIEGGEHGRWAERRNRLASRRCPVATEMSRNLTLLEYWFGRTHTPAALFL